MERTFRRAFFGDARRICFQRSLTFLAYVHG
jgi:hypothetical protein